jgi:signal transduction histidine kinase/ligand-binding sensor domain-containing protein
MRLFALAIAWILLPATPAEPLNAAHSLAQYGHTVWTLREGQLLGYPRAVTQTADGYLWLGTGYGLLRFDGFQFVRWSGAHGALPSQVVTALLAANDGSLWVGTDNGLARISNGSLRSFGALDGHHVNTLLQSRDGVIHVAAVTGRNRARLCAIASATVRCDEPGTWGRFILSLHEASDGALWVGAATGLWRIGKDDARQSFATPADQQEIHGITTTATQQITVALNRQVAVLERGTLRSLGAAALSNLKPTTLLRDSAGTLWIGTQDQGVIRVGDRAVEQYGRRHGLSADFVVSLLEDREGNVWVGTLGGLDRFRDVIAAKVATTPAESSAPVMAVHAATTASSVWVTTVNGLHSWRDGRLTLHALPGVSHKGPLGSVLASRDGRRLWLSTTIGLDLYSLPLAAPATQDRAIRYVHAMIEDRDGTVWLSDREQGLVHLAGATRGQWPWSTFGGRQARALTLNPDGGVWLGFVEGGVALLQDGVVTRQVDARDGLSAGSVNDVRELRDGIIVSTQNGFSLVGGNTMRTMSPATGLPCAAVHWAIDDRPGNVWLHTECGLLRIASEEIEAWLQRKETPRRFDVYDTADGILRYSDLGGYGPKVARARDGRIWFATYDGLYVVDPGRIESRQLPPIVHVDKATADGKTYDVHLAGTLPPSLRDLRIDYTALGLTAPEKLRFRYQLEGRDRDWIDGGDRRQAFYTDLAPGSYRFRISAANGRGLRSTEDAVWEFKVLPSLIQTGSFQLVAVLIVSALLYGLYRLRVLALEARMNERFAERLGERNRIAQDLHDTLLQGFISSSMQLQLLADDVSEPSVLARLRKVIQRISDVIEEGRNAVAGLRSSTPDDLEAALARDCERFRGSKVLAARLVVNGERRPLNEVVRDAIYQIAREALANACRHADARHIEIEFEYSTDGLAVHVRDDGKGIEKSVLAHGKDGHWGLSGMRERATSIGGELTLFSRPRAGTEIKLKLPARIAFRNGKAKPRPSRI